MRLASSILALVLASGAGCKADRSSSSDKASPSAAPAAPASSAHTPRRVMPSRAATAETAGATDVTGSAGDGADTAADPSDPAATEDAKVAKVRAAREEAMRRAVEMRRQVLVRANGDAAAGQPAARPPVNPGVAATEESVRKLEEATRQRAAAGKPAGWVPEPTPKRPSTAP